MSTVELSESCRESIIRFVATSSEQVFLRSDFRGFGSPTGVGRALRSLLDDAVLYRFGLGVYVRARRSSFDGRPVPMEPSMTLALYLMSRLGIKAERGSSWKALDEGRSTQVPMIPIINVGSSRMSRSLGTGARKVRIERKPFSEGQ